MGCCISIFRVFFPKTSRDTNVTEAKNKGTEQQQIDNQGRQKYIITTKDNNNSLNFNNVK
jgi:hypothetical protein